MQDDTRQRIENLECELASLRAANPQADVTRLQGQLEMLGRTEAQTLTPWERVQLARHPKRPHALDYIQRMFTDFVEIHGDRDRKSVV